ncbi:MAG: hypothetical protein UX52_C0004G0009 [Candidatus Amesbacteria bacterium GW2011_GWA1_46_35]|uniref:Uncharacterized protein n=1 Tax=Candidatus Amesbacteria bacterium GW2011_GWC2_45_19 TaxID=1618366 RepID=A0A0G1Q3Z8_9BACT|nr:MAG: hypothetical protein UX05_C0001G0009 [Candidatus Amesbacteria bacterium GW2011_GWC2_45_19]KKU38539.1 MAG: hypothetical protein UX52_C0004G0009 [Candidatus Amesbacteria bacterium GW2011_GWA1_46_35]KKU69640.1 MAG: hypothetical protein UX93_C0001G0225 [Microgenomates group bacterium GW2011_GWC1_47_20]
MFEAKSSVSEGITWAFRGISVTGVPVLAAGLGLGPRSSLSESDETTITPPRSIVSKLDQFSKVFYLFLLP